MLVSMTQPCVAPSASVLGCWLWQVGSARGGDLVQRNAYMLLYRCQALGPPSLPALPADLQAEVDAKNKVGHAAVN